MTVNHHKEIKWHYPRAELAASYLAERGVYEIEDHQLAEWLVSTPGLMSDGDDESLPSNPTS